jgi:hypothetical protein
MKAAVLSSTQMPAQKNALGGTITTKHYSSFFGPKTTKTTKIKQAPHLTHKTQSNQACE